MTLELIHRLQAFSNAIRQTCATFYRISTDSMLAVSVSYLSLLYELGNYTTDKKIVCARNTESG